MNRRARAATWLTLVLVTACSTHHPRSTAPTSGSSSSTLAPLYLRVHTGIRLAVADADGVKLIDLDASTATPLNASQRPDHLLNIGGTLVVLSSPPSNSQNGEVDAVSSASSRPLRLSDAYKIFPSVNPGDLWLVYATAVSGDAIAVDGTVQEFSVSGQRTAMAVPLADRRVPRADVGVGLITDFAEAGPDAKERLDVWEPEGGTFVRSVTSNGRMLAASGHTMVWQAPSAASTLHVTDLSTGADRAVRLDHPLGNVDGAALDHDAGRLALTQIRQAPLIVDLTAGRVVEVTTTEDQGTPAWSPDGQWLFYAAGLQKVAAYHIGDAAPTELPVNFVAIHDLVVW